MMFMFVFQIEEIDLPYDKMKNMRRQFCFITFESEEICDKVCLDAKQTIAGNEVGLTPCNQSNNDANMKIRYLDFRACNICSLVLFSYR